MKLRQSLFKFREMSVGNPFFIFHLMGWKIASHLTRPRKVVSGDTQFTLPCKNWITHFRWYLFNNKEPEVRHYIDRYLTADDVLFDIGANIGVFSVYAAKKGVQVYSFEPEYSNLALLKENILNNKLNKRIKSYSVGISDFVGFSQLHLQSIEEGAAAHSENKTDIAKTDEGYSVVYDEGITTVTIDYICEQLKVIPTSLKIDTDGNELKILNGAKNTLQNLKLKSLVIEMPVDQDKTAKCTEILKSQGFKIDWSDTPKTSNQIWIR